MTPRWSQKNHGLLKAVLLVLLPFVRESLGCKLTYTIPLPIFWWAHLSPYKVQTAVDFFQNISNLCLVWVKFKLIEDSTNNQKPHFKFIAVISCHDPPSWFSSFRFLLFTVCHLFGLAWTEAVCIKFRVLYKVPTVLEKWGENSEPFSIARWSLKFCV